MAVILVVIPFIDCAIVPNSFPYSDTSAHIKNMHTQDGQGKLLCSYCGRSYETLTSYKAHYTQNLCIKVVIPGFIQDVEDPTNDGDEEEEEEGGEGEVEEFTEP